jgi:hypothetical protein
LIVVTSKDTTHGCLEERYKKKVKRKVGKREKEWNQLEKKERSFIEWV